MVLDLGFKGGLMFNFVMSFNFVFMLDLLLGLHARWMMNCMSPVFMCKPVLEVYAGLLVLIMEWYENE